jgi:hypothetical protein
MSAAAQTEKRLNSAPQAFRAFFAGFKNAVAKNDKTRIAAMTRFPLKYGFDAGDEGTMTRSQFIKRYKEIFGDASESFLPEKNPVFSNGDGGSYVVSTRDASHFVFVKSGSTFKFTAYIVEP